MINSTHQDELKECALVNLEELCIPGADVICSLLLVLIILRRRGVVLVVGAPLYHLLQDGSVYIGQRHRFLLVIVHPQI